MSTPRSSSGTHKEGIYSASPYEKTLYYRQMQLRELTKDWKTGPSAVVDHGANPGLISHFTKQGLIDIASKLVGDKKSRQKRASV